MGSRVHNTVAVNVPRRTKLFIAIRMVLGETELSEIKLVKYADLADETRFCTSLNCCLNVIRSDGSGSTNAGADFYGASLQNSRVKQRLRRGLNNFLNSNKRDCSDISSIVIATTNS